MRFYFIILFFLLANPMFAQVEFITSFNSTHSGRNISFTISKTINSKHELGGGLRFNINKLEMSDDQSKVFMKRLYASEFYQHLGVAGYYQYHIFRNWEHVKPFLFYDIQATYSTTRNRTFAPTGLTLNGHDLYALYINRYGPFTWVDQNIGIGFKTNLPGRFFISQKIGIGTCFILGKDRDGDNLLAEKYFNWFTWEFGGLINVGIGYRFR